MITIVNKSTDPYFNQAFEEYVFNNIKDDKVLIVWRNKPAIIVGCYQNICKEVSAYALKKAGVPIVRRMSGGGTVYHDLGNINYTLIHDKEGFIDYDDFLTPVIDALNRLGVKAHKDRTCDISIGGKKISGSAQKVSSGRVLHHGTLLFDSDLTVLDEITTKNKNESFISKAADSAICKVTNIKEASDTKLDIESFMSAFSFEISGKDSKTLELGDKELEEIEKLSEEKYQSWEWTWAKTPAFVFEKEGVFEECPISVTYSTKKGIVADFKISCDLINEKKAYDLFNGQKFSPAVFEELAYALVGDNKEILMKLIM